MGSASFYLAVAGLLLLSVGCGKANPPSAARENPPSVADQANPHRQASGTITENIQKLQRNEFREDCDKNPETMRQQRELASAIDARQTEIEELAGTLPPGARWKRAALGPIFVNEPVTPGESKSGW